LSPFTEELWKTVEDVYEAILEHPFLRELTTGELSMEAFKRYIIQDALYLSRFSRAVALVAVKAPSDEDALTLLKNAEGALSVERVSLHEFLMSEWGVTRQQLYENVMTPVNRAYTDFLIATAYEGSFQLGLAAVLPCFWVYLEVGRTLLRRGSPNKTYQRWIDTYASEEYAKAVEEVIQIMEKVSKEMSVGEKLEAKRLFRTSTIYEYLFWDEAYRMGGWPLPISRL